MRKTKSRLARAAPKRTARDGAKAAAGGKRARTRATLIEAAAAAVAEHGFQRANLEDIAARAGMTTGAIYSNFESKEDLFLAVILDKNLQLTPDIEQSLSLEQVMQRIAESFIALMPRAKGERGFAAELQFYALTSEAMRRRLAREYERAFDAQAEFWATHAPEADGRVSPALLPAILQSLSMGLLYQSLLTPDRITKEVVQAAFGALAQPK